ncbi:retinal protein, putative [Perkinsus marinus ATCC 50983]|uniref:Retinal protein, putative n=1 Tax=Perkinsus marinus (strain ATCC 50983 / TXsc) TaxID=423536 RepID=C5KD86_PERM5|nr:retinal protein, putative [Perkinsus marinus ATCC 50983]EER17519.1 retinal protein, putative [Perkinsus marinus ATCC 50983]|eukprot:XP_002785723.1 retinal protein, putative [Perkinsus marinus ATCC 50983]
MIERHYFKDKILKSYDFTMPYCMPNTVNTWEVIYELPELTAEEKKAMIEAPWETKSIMGIKTTRAETSDGDIYVYVFRRTTATRKMWTSEASQVSSLVIAQR